MATQERAPYNRPQGRSTQYEYSEKEAVKTQEDDRRTQERARKAGELAVEATDDLLADIDEILREEELVFKAFQQVGGE